MTVKLTKNVFKSRNIAWNEKFLGNAGRQMGLHLETQRELINSAEILPLVWPFLELARQGVRVFWLTALPSIVTVVFISNKNPYTIVPTPFGLNWDNTEVKKY